MSPILNSNYKDFNLKFFLEKLEKNYPKVFEQARKHGLTILLVGRTGVGKSSTINTFMGEDIEKKAKVGKFVPCTDEVNKYSVSTNDINFTLIDTPGLADGRVDDQKRIENISSKVTKYDCMWFVTILDTQPIRTDEKNTIKCISSAFGKQGWKKAIIVFTQADKIEKNEYQKCLDTKTKLIKEEIKNNNIDENIVQVIPSVAVANDPKGGKPRLTQDGKYWLNKLYMAVIRRISDSGLLPMLISTENRVILNNTDNLSGKEELIKLSLPDTNELQKKVEEYCSMTLSPSVNRKGSYKGYILLCGFICAAIGTLFLPIIGTIIGGIIGLVLGNMIKLIYKIYFLPEDIN